MAACHCDAVIKAHLPNTKFVSRQARNLSHLQFRVRAKDLVPELLQPRCGILTRRDGKERGAADHGHWGWFPVQLSTVTGRKICDDRAAAHALAKYLLKIPSHFPTSSFSMQVQGIAFESVYAWVIQIVPWRCMSLKSRRASCTTCSARSMAATSFRLPSSRSRVCSNRCRCRSGQTESLAADPFRAHKNKVRRTNNDIHENSWYTIRPIEFNHLEIFSNEQQD